MAIAQAQPMTHHLSASHTSVAAKACSDVFKPKPLRVVSKPAAPARVQTTPVFVGIAG